MGAYHGSYSSGFAPRDFAPRYPSLWQGCVGAFCPGLGPAGTNLIDWSGYREDGTLTGFTMANAYVPTSGGRYAINSPQSATTYVQVPVANGNALDVTGTKISFGGWCYPKISNAYQLICGKLSSSVARQYALYFSGAGTTRIFVAVNGVLNGDQIISPAWIVNAWNFVWFNYNGATVNVWLGTDTSAPVIAFSFSSTSAISNVSGSNFYLCQGGTVDNANPLNGYVDDVRIYNRALLPQEIALLGRRRGIAFDYVRRAGAAASSKLLLWRRRKAVV